MFYRHLPTLFKYQALSHSGNALPIDLENINSIQLVSVELCEILVVVSLGIGVTKVLAYFG